MIKSLQDYTISPKGMKANGDPQYSQTVRNMTLKSISEEDHQSASIASPNTEKERIRFN